MAEPNDPSIETLLARIGELEEDVARLKERVDTGELNVGRINVRDESGQARIIIHSEECMPGDWERVAYAGITYYAADGTEVGALAVLEKNVRITIDQHATNEVVSVDNHDSEFGTRRGVSVFEQFPGLPGEQRENFRARFGRDPNPREVMIPRAFAGYRFGEAVVALGDSHGRERIRLSIDAQDNPRLEFLDEKGAVQFLLPPNGNPRSIPQSPMPAQIAGETVLQLLALVGHDADSLLRIVESEGASIPEEWVRWIRAYKELSAGSEA